DAEAERGAGKGDILDYSGVVAHKDMKVEALQIGILTDQIVEDGQLLLRRQRFAHEGSQTGRITIPGNEDPTAEHLESPEGWYVNYDRNAALLSHIARRHIDRSYDVYHSA